MTIFGYTLPEIQKFLLALAALVIAGVAMFVGLDPSFQGAVETLIVALIGAVSIFSVPNPDPASVNKAWAAFVTSMITVLQFYQHVPSGLVTKIVAFVFALATTYCIWRKSNKPAVQVGQQSLVR